MSIEVTIPIEMVTDVHMRFSIGNEYTLVAGYADHPAFTTLRNKLAALGYIIKPEYPCWNGDRVVKPFTFNGVKLDRGDTFWSAVVWSIKLRRLK